MYETSLMVERYWGDGGDGSGKNRLGCLLMEVRDELSGETTTPTQATSSTITTTTTATTKVEEGETTEESGEGEAEQDTGSEEETGEKEQQGESAEVIEGLEPNKNHMNDPGLTEAGGKVAKRGRKGKRAAGGGGKTKKEVFRDADGTSKLEKTSDVAGYVTVIGDGTVFSEKALPPLAKSVVYLIPSASFSLLLFPPLSSYFPLFHLFFLFSFIFQKKQTSEATKVPPNREGLGGRRGGRGG